MFKKTIIRGSHNFFIWFFNEHQQKWFGVYKQKNVSFDNARLLSQTPLWLLKHNSALYAYYSSVSALSEGPHEWRHSQSDLFSFLTLPSLLLFLVARSFSSIVIFFYLLSHKLTLNIEMTVQSCVSELSWKSLSFISWENPASKVYVVVVCFWTFLASSKYSLSVFAAHENLNSRCVNPWQ